MWISKAALIELKAENKALRMLQRTKDEKVNELSREARNNSVSIGELSSARRSLISLCKARKDQIREADLVPVGLDDMAEAEVLKDMERLEAQIFDLTSVVQNLSAGFEDSKWVPVTFGEKE